jgi:hypothetical protein
MDNSKKDGLSEKNIFTQIMIICGFFFSALLIIINLKRTSKTSELPSNQPLDKLHTSPIPPTLPEVDEKKISSSKENRVTLTKFIEDNEKLINVLGVFTAITVFVGELRLQAFGYALSFMFMTLTVLLWLELWSKFPSESGDWKITWFENILFLTVLAILVYWLIDFRDIWHEFLFILIFGIISGLFSVVMKKFGIFNKLFHTQAGKLKWLRYIFGIIILIIIISGSWLLAQSIAPMANEVLDSINESIRNSP